MTPERAEVICTNVLPSKTAFGVRIDNGEQVFVPSSVSEAILACTGDTFFATLVPNNHQPDKTPWYALRLERGNSEPVAPTSVMPAGADAKAFNFIRAAESYVTTQEVCEELNLDMSTTMQALALLFHSGLIVRANVHANPTSKQPEFFLWAKDISVFS